MSDNSQSKVINRLDNFTHAERQILADIDALTVPGEVDSHKPEGGTEINPALLELMRAVVAAERADAKANGWTAQAQRAIDEHRKGVGRSDYNATRRAAYASATLDRTGRLPRPYGTPDSSAKRLNREGQVADAQAKRRAAMTPEQLADEQARNTAAKAARRQAKREAEAAEREARGKF